MDDLCYSFLKLFSERTSLSINQLSAILNLDSFEFVEVINYLRKNGFLRVEHNYSMVHKSDHDSISPRTPLSITFEGKRALELERKSRKRFKYNEIRAWITLAIAIAAFALSVICFILK